jgi:hypothetical protein
MNVQRITDTEWSYYVLKYTTKAEPDGYLSLDEEAAELLGLFGLTEMQRKLVASTVCSKPTSIAELLCLMGLVPIIETDADVVSINTMPPSEQWVSQHDLSRKGAPKVADADVYCTRPDPFENFGLPDYFRWCVVRDNGSARPQGARWETPHKDGFNNDVWFLKQPRVVRTSNVNPASKPQAFYYQLLIKHTHFRSLDELEPVQGDYLTECARRGLICCVADLHSHLEDYLQYNMVTRANLQELRTKALKGSDADVLRWYLPDPQAGHEGITDADLRRALQDLEELMPCIGADSEYQTPEQLVDAMIAQLRRSEVDTDGCWGEERFRPPLLEQVHAAGALLLEQLQAAAESAVAPTESASPSQPVNSADHHLPLSELPSSWLKDEGCSSGLHHLHSSELPSSWLQSPSVPGEDEASPQVPSPLASHSRPLASGATLLEMLRDDADSLSSVAYHDTAAQDDSDEYDEAGFDADAVAEADYWAEEAAKLGLGSSSYGSTGAAPSPPPSPSQLKATSALIEQLGGYVHLVGLSAEQETAVMDVVATLVFAPVAKSATECWPIVIALSGGPGTGKTHTLTALVNLLRHLQLNFLVGATTHAAAQRLGVPGASTVDSHLKLVPGHKLQHLPPMDPTNLVLCQCHGISVDEMSMLSSHKAQVVAYRLKCSTKVGSLRKVLVLSGDRHQLPAPCRHTLLKGICPNCHLQASSVWQTARHHRLTKSFRHESDPEFGGFLTSIEDKQPTQRSIDAVLGGCMVPDTPTAIHDLYKPGAKVLCSHIVDVLKVNSMILQMESIAPTDAAAPLVTRRQATGVLIKQYKQTRPVDPRLFKYAESDSDKSWGSDKWKGHTLREVAVGAPVFFTAIVNKSSGAVTSGEGIIRDFKTEGGLVTKVVVEVLSTGKLVHVSRSSYHARTVGEVSYSRLEFPLILAYAMTAHRCQGATMRGRVIIMCRDAFAGGMLYVMLSRVPDRKDLHIIGDLTPDSFMPAQLTAADVTREGLRAAAKARKRARR